jgi:hypothetical protein
MEFLMCNETIDETFDSHPPKRFRQDPSVLVVKESSVKWRFENNDVFKSDWPHNDACLCVECVLESSLKLRFENYDVLKSDWKKLLSSDTGFIACDPNHGKFGEFWLPHNDACLCVECIVATRAHFDYCCSKCNCCACGALDVIAFSQNVPQHFGSVGGRHITMSRFEHWLVQLGFTGPTSPCDCPYEHVSRYEH